MKAIGHVPLVPMTEIASAYDAAAERGTVLLKECGSCGTWDLPFHRMCHACGSLTSTLRASSGRAVVWSVTVFHKLYLSEWAPRLPYNVVVLALDEGPRLFGNVTGVPHHLVVPQMRVRAVVGQSPEGGAMLQFEPDDHR